MANVQDLLYHGIRENIRRVLTALGEEQVDKGLTAFEDGASNWSNCFFARALADDTSLASYDPEGKIASILGLQKPDGSPNLVPIRTVWRTFDGASQLITAEELKKFITEVRDESRPEVLALLRSIDYASVETQAVEPQACPPDVFICR